MSRPTGGPGAAPSPWHAVHHSEAKREVGERRFLTTAVTFFLPIASHPPWSTPQLLKDSTSPSSGELLSPLIYSVLNIPFPCLLAPCPFSELPRHRPSGPSFSGMPMPPLRSPWHCLLVLSWEQSWGGWGHLASDMIISHGLDFALSH